MTVAPYLFFFIYNCMFLVYMRSRSRLTLVRRKPLQKVTKEVESVLNKTDGIVFVFIYFFSLRPSVCVFFIVFSLSKIVENNQNKGLFLKQGCTNFY